MRRALALLTLLLAASPAAAQDRAADIAAAVEREVVYVAPARGEALGVGERGELSLRIVRKDIGRIKIAVVPRSWGSARELAEGVDREIDVPGALLVVAGNQVHVITSHEHAADAVGAVQRAFDRGGGLAAQLRRSIDGLAEVDPGPSGDIRAPQETPGVPDLGLPDVEGVVDDVTGTIRFVFVGVIAFITAVFALVAIVFWRRHRFVSEATEEELADRRAEIEHERGRLGQDIVELDAASAFGGDARAAYERALDAYERSELALARADNRRRMQAAGKLVADGRAAAQQARVASGA